MRLDHLLSKELVGPVVGLVPCPGRVFWGWLLIGWNVNHVFVLVAVSSCTALLWGVEGGCGGGCGCVSVLLGPEGTDVVFVVLVVRSWVYCSRWWGCVSGWGRACLFFVNCRVDASIFWFFVV